MAKEAGANRGCKHTTKTGKKRAAMATPEDTSSSESESNNSRNADLENCAAEINRQTKGTALRIWFVQYPINIEKI